ncbi:unnamed protein product [Phytophthora fragariaefolia]|uniref:Unnamed protein product n=1 Tax=Phytophthora fragariaefolia TaxID=1490495 RepID=A0A9W6UA27_9STRA|nr:unnamed protein product [Phytophthora fragariaefolia]
MLSRSLPPEGSILESDSSVESLIVSSPVARRKSTSIKKSKKKHDPTLPYEDWSADEIRKECTRRKLRVPSGMNKDLRISALERHDASKAAYAAKVPGDTVEEVIVDGKSVRTKHCMFRLVNILFSDGFATHRQKRI